MSLERQIKEARKALEDLTTDEAELVRLEAEQTAEIQALKASGTRDFAALASLEGKRAALGTMLAEQRRAIQDAQADLQRLEGEQADRERIERFKATAAAIRGKRADLHAGIQGLAQTLEAELVRLIRLKEEWLALKNGFVEEAAAQGVPIQGAASYDQRRDDAVREYFAQLERLGVDVEALRLNPDPYNALRAVRGDVSDRLPMSRDFGQDLSYHAPFGPRVGLIALDVYQKGTLAYYLANDPKARAYQEQMGAGHEW